ncbi:hypothetical protein Q0S19_03050 [Stenotrophomonas indicatrix]|jgi:hypothetical protein|uniref:hypothetical protein n=2 Tax=Stenotrophomonas indicatrix TaxID=2045451 RepID=UPI002651E3D3|nr:hypothetical protein [Stenotrophomonas indicatrix]MDN8643451.1 hypothetical protein [Stenotrophomonas indicatrix]
MIVDLQHSTWSQRDTRHRAINSIEREAMKIHIETVRPIQDAAQAGLSSSDWIAISSAAIALIAFGYSVYQGYLQRRHNELSSKPMLELQISNSSTILSIRNEGFGPGILTHFNATIHGATVDLLTEEGMAKFFEAATAEIEESYVYQMQHLLPYTVFGPGKEMDILSISTDLSDESTEKLLASLEELPLSITYKCIYDIEHKNTCNFSKSPTPSNPSWHQGAAPSTQKPNDNDA